MTVAAQTPSNRGKYLGLLALAVVVVIGAGDLDLENTLTWDQVAQGNQAESYIAAGQIPPPVDLPIQNIPQETNVWCWAAVSQQIIHASVGASRTPPQCALVGVANGWGTQACCHNPAPCTRTGSLEEIQSLIQHFGGRSSTIAPPTDPMKIYQTLSNGHAIVLAVQSSPYSGHVVVLRGMAWQPGPQGLEPVLFVNDPMAYFTQPIPFRNISKHWLAAIVVN